MSLPSNTTQVKQGFAYTGLLSKHKKFDRYFKIEEA
jgi:hypothetical protein